MDYKVKRIVVGITGASGAVYAQGVIRELCRLNIEVHLVVTKFGKRLLHDELGMQDGHVDLPALTGMDNSGITLYPANDIGAAIASGSFLHDGMIIVPCSSNTLGSIASGIGSNLLCRAAAVTLKERRRLVLCHREMPLSHIDIENMHKLSIAGAVIAPANPGWYFKPQTVTEISDFVVARLLDTLGITNHNIGKRWE